MLDAPITGCADRRSAKPAVAGGAYGFDGAYTNGRRAPILSHSALAMALASTVREMRLSRTGFDGERG
jgi:hypothetical protein